MNAPLFLPRGWLKHCVAGGLLLLVSTPALAQEIRLWMVAGVVSPLWALVLIFALALAAPRLRKAGFHALLLVIWIVAFILASEFVVNDWVIWTPMHLYILQLALLPIILFHELLRRIEASAVTTTRTVLLGVLSVLLSVPTALFVTFLMILPWDYFGRVTGIHTIGKQGPDAWCFIVTWIVLQYGMLIAWIVHRNRRAGAGEVRSQKSEGRN